LRRTAKRVLPDDAYVDFRRRYHRATAWPPVGLIRFGSLRRVTPFNRVFGSNRGSPIDRYYIDAFLTRHTGVEGYAPGAIRGRVLEVGETRYTRAFGDASAVESVDVLDASSTNPDATLIADLADGTGIPSEAYDCVICTQTLLLIYDLRAAVRTLHRALRPGGTVLATVPGISQICRPDMEIWGDYWRFTTASTRRLFEEVFEPADVIVESHGNVLSATGFLYGLAAEDLKRAELDVHDPDYELVIAIKAVKCETAATPPKDPSAGR
jgi:SAM-dependent methyltransferase